MEFALLTYLTCLGLRKWKSEWPLRTVLIVSSFLGLLYACADEFHQTFIPQRGGRLTDVLIDLIGVSLAVGIFAWRSRSYQPQLKPASETK